ncbi:hypothetical protein EON67_01050 [archaeon]|nr:MAG: hypothetical protein EON67_01050 [archaeon]
MRACVHTSLCCRSMTPWTMSWLVSLRAQLARGIRIAHVQRSSTCWRVELHACTVWCLVCVCVCVCVSGEMHAASHSFRARICSHV